MDESKGTDLSLLEPSKMLKMYSLGAFPMAEDDGTIDWYFPQVRTIIPLNDFNLPKSLRKFIEKSDFKFRFDCDSMNVIENCANREETWISSELVEAYERLYKLGFLHSVEVYQNNILVGGLYGISYKGAFFGESMFSKISQASKCALVKLIEHLNKKGFVLLDIQFMTDHLKMFGAKEISIEEYQDLLFLSHKKNVKF